MENIKENKNIKYIWQDNKFSTETISNINHTNINNNINITNYYPSPRQDYCNKETYTFINDNGNVQNVMSYPIKTATHKTKKLKDSSPTPIPIEKKYHQCQSPYMKKILPTSKRQKSEDGNRIIYKYKNSPSYKHLKSNKKKEIKNNFYNEINDRKSETQSNINSKPIITKENNYYLDLSSDEISNKHKTNRNHNHMFYTNNNINSSSINKIKYFENKSHNRAILNNNKFVMSYESNGNGSESIFNIVNNPYQLPVKNKNKNPLYKISLYENNNLITNSFNNYNRQKFVKSQKSININYKKENSVEKKLNKFIILIQSVARGFLLRLKLAQYLNFYERIKKIVSIIQYLIYQRKKYVFYFFVKNNINKKLSKYYNMYSNITPMNNISIEYQKYNNIKNNNKMIKKNEINEIEKELNKKKIDYAVAEKKIKELMMENKKIQNINNIIVRDNKQLALKLKNLENNNIHGYTYNKLKIENNNFNILNLINKKEIQLKRNNLLIKIITRKIILIKSILYKYFYEFNYITKLIKIDNKKKFIIENNNFLINKTIINNNSINNNEIIDIEKRNKKLNNIINKKDISHYVYRNIFEKWMMRSLIFKSKDFIKEKKKKKKEKFKQRKQKKLYGCYKDKNDKKNDEENENSGGDSDEYEGKNKFRNKSKSSKKNSNYYEENYKNNY